MCQPTSPTTPTVVEAPLLPLTQQDFASPPPRRTSIASRRPSLAPIDEDSETAFDEEEQDDSISQDPFSNIDMSAEFFSTFQSLPPVIVDDQDNLPNIAQQSAEVKEEANTPPPRRLRKRVQFSTVSIRNYDVQVGDNVPIKAGVPLQLDWYYEQQPTISLDEYEASTRKGRKPRQFRLSPHKRWEILVQAGFDIATLNQARKEAFQIRASRKLSNVLLPADLTFQRLASSLV